MSDQLTQVGRLAFRDEGQYWVAYYALPDSMRDAIKIGSIMMTAVTSNTDRKQAFMDIMRGFVADIIEEKIGLKPTWGGPETAPEHERGGHS